jgi:hypothetical protein
MTSTDMDFRACCFWSEEKIYVPNTAIRTTSIAAPMINGFLFDELFCS